MPNSPTIVAASLDSKQLEDSISKLVQTVNAKTDEMAKHFTDKVGQMEQVIKNFGNMKFEGSSGGGTNKLTEGQKSLETQTKRTTQAAKEQQMTFDQLVQGLKQAMGVVSNFNTLRQHIDPSKQDYAEYERALARIVEYNDKLRTSALGLAQANEKAYSYNARNDAKNLFAVDERLKQLNQYYAEEERLSKRASEKRIAAQEKETAAQKKMIDEQYKLAFSRANKIPTDQYDLAQAKLERLQALLRDMRERGLLSPSQIASTENEIRRLEQVLGQVNQSQQQTTQSAHQYTEEIRKQAQSIRDSQQWKEKGFAVVNGTTLYNLESDTTPLKNRVALEEQLVQLHKSSEASIMQQAADENTLAQATRLTDEELKKIYVDQQRINEEINRRANRGKADGTSPFQSYDSLRQSMAAVLGLQEQQIKLADSETGSYNQLNATLKQLKQTYDALSKSDRNSEQGKVLIASIHEVERAIQRIRSQSARPVSLESIIGINGKGGLSEKTLDDIAYKMQRLASYRSGLNVETQKKEISTVNAEYDRLKKKMDEVMQKNQSMIASNNALGRSWNYMKNRLAFYFTVGASTQFIKNLIEVRSQYEMNERALGILIDSAERGTQIFNELSQMALVSPYTLIELSTAAKQLTAYDVAARDVVDTTRRLADMAAAVGIPIERLTYALGQIKAYGYLNSRDARMFANAGIPLVKQLSEYYTEIEGKLVSTADVYDRIKKKAIDYSEVMEVINHMTDEGGKFFDFQAKMADTLKVRLANLTLAWNNMLNEMGKDTQGVLTWGIGALRDLFKHWKEIDKAVKSAAWVVGIKVAFDFLLLGLNRAGLALGMWTHKMALSEVVGKRLAATMISLGRTMASLAASRMTWITLAVMTTIELISALNGANEAQKALNESIRKGAEDNYNNTSKFLEQYKNLRESLYETRKVAIGNIYDPSSKKAAATAYSEESFAKDIDNNEAKKAWEAIREKIELTTASSDRYIQSLLSIKNMSERIRQGFVVLEDIQTVNAALKELGDETIKVEKDVSIFFGLLDIKDGLINNLKDYEKELDNIIKKYGSVAAMKDDTFLGGKGSDDLNDYQTALERLRDDLQVTTDSIINFIELKGWSGDVGKINQVFEQITQKLTLDNQLDPQKAYLLQIEVEEARSKAAKAAQLARIKDLEAAWNAETDAQKKKEIAEEYTKQAEIYNAWGEYNGRKKVEWERFTKWLKEQHISETTAMFRNMDAEDIKSLNFQEGKHAEFVTRMVEKYAKENKMSYDEAFNYLKSWVTSANQWSVFIPLVISTEDKKTVYQQLGEYDKLVDEADAQIERLTKRIGELRAKKELDKKETEELTKAEQELADAEKSKRDAEAKGGHGKKEKKDERAATEAQKQAETELQKALKDEIQLIEQVRSQYKKLADAGVKRGTALTMVTTQFGASIEHINKILQKNGLPKFDIKAFAGTDDPHAILAMLKAQIDRAKTSSNIKPEEIKALEVEVGKVTVDAQVYDTTKITKGLNNELDKLKEEYELAVELDANPELGGMFAEMFDIDLETLPKTAEEYADQYTKFLNKYLKEKGSDLSLPNLLNLTSWDMNAFREQMEKGDMNKEWYDVILKGYLATREARKKETSETIKDYEKLLEKYAEYETKVNKIQNDAVKERVAFAQQFGSEDDKNMALNLQTQILAATDPREKQKLIQQLQELVKSIAGDDKAKLNIVTSIDNSETKGLAKASFEKFQKSPEWITATGELSGMTNKAINGLIASLEKYKKSAKNLDPKQIKNINNALKNLYKEQRKNNPFGAIANMIDKAKERMADVEPEMESIMSDIIALEKEIGDGKATEGQIKTLDDLKERWQTLFEIGEISAGEWVDSLMSVYGAIKGAIGLFDDLAKAIGGTSASDIEKIFGVLDKAGQGAQIGAAFGGYGAAIGAVVGGLTGVIETFADQWSGNAAITEKVEESVRAVKRLEVAYVDLQQAVDKAYGTAVIGAQQATLANKELQLAEIQRQIQLEKSRESKNRDEDKILDLQKQYKELFYEIQNGYRELVDDLMGTDVASFAENLVSSMIDAFKQGEDYMDVFNKKFDEMIDNMIMKSIVSRVVSQYLNQIWDSIDQRINDRSQEERNEYAKAQSNAEKVRGMSDGELAMEIARQRLNDDGVDMLQTLTTLTDKDIEEYRKAVAAEEIAAKKRLDAASEFTGSDVDYIMGQITEVMPELGQKLKEILGEYYKFGEASDKNLSALQQGIQGITEDTAGALEGYMNGVSQQVYLQSDLLTQIRDAVIGLTTDAGLGVQAQMLFQLQQSYLVQQSIEGMMRNVLSPSERAFQVELVS